MELLKLADTYNEHAETIILIVALFIFCRIILFFIKAINMKRAIYVEKETFSQKGIDKKTGSFVTEEKQNFLMGDIHKKQKDFDNIVSSFALWTQSISILPMLGLLGTVSHLIPALNALSVLSADEFSILVGNLNGALTTTFLGILFAIILKVVAFLPAAILEGTANSIDSINREYDDYLKSERFINEEE